MISSIYNISTEKCVFSQKISLAEMPIQIMDPNSNENPVLKVERPFYDKQQFNNALYYDNTKEKQAVCSNPMENVKANKIFLSVFPILAWLSRYNIKTDLIADLIAGFTVGVMHIPQGNPIIFFLYFFVAIIRFNFRNGICNVS